MALTDRQWQLHVCRFLAESEFRRGRKGACWLHLLRSVWED